MDKVLIIRYGEVALKGLNKSYFENKLMKHIGSNLREIGKTNIWKSNGLLFASMDGFEEKEFVEKVIKVFGIVSVSIAYSFEVDMEKIYQVALEHITEKMEQRKFKTFKIETRRGDKSFNWTSPEISSKVGGYILRNLEELTVDVHNPDFKLYVDIREKCYIYSDKISGYGGLPLGTNGKALLLLSGGIDSPVAGWMMAKRGVEIEAVHYHSYPFTSERAKEKVVELARILAKYCGNIRLHSINLLPIQKEINEKCPEGEMTILSRRFMMKIAEKIAKNRDCSALITGENIGQVASQTMEGLTVTHDAVELLTFRPLIALDKVDIIELAKKIDTFDTSILPFEDCCTVFLPKRPLTKPRVDRIRESESKLESEKLIEDALLNMTVEHITFN